MSNNSFEQGFVSRYETNRILGDYPPWRGLGVTDSLSERRFLLFTLPPPDHVSISVEDLQMRDALFAREESVIEPVAAIRRSNHSINILLPHTDLIPLTKALPSMHTSTAGRLLRVLVGEVLERIERGLTFGNLVPESLVVVGDEIRILPTAYLLPGAVLDMILGRATVKRDRTIADVTALGRIVHIVARYLDDAAAGACREAAARLERIGDDTTADVLADAVAGLADATGTDRRPSVFGGRPARFEIDDETMQRIRQIAERARGGEKRLVILRGNPGSGKSRFAGEVAGRLVETGGFSRVWRPGDQTLYRSVEEIELPDGYDAAVIEDRHGDPLIGSWFVERIANGIERFDLLLVVTGNDGDTLLVDTLRDMAERREVAVDVIELPPLEPDMARRILADLAPPNRETEVLEGLGGDDPIAVRVPIGRARAAGRRVDGADTASLLTALSDEERSILTFLCVFAFEIPLSVLRDVYDADGDGMYRAIHDLVTLGLVEARAEFSEMAGGDLGLVYRPASRLLADDVLRSLPEERRTQLHEKIALFLRETGTAPVVFSFFHLARGGRLREAALNGYELFQQFLGRRQLSAVNYFNESYTAEGLDRHLPPELRLKLHLEIGRYFALIGRMDAAEELYRQCRRETEESADVGNFRSLAVEAVRRECEILEKKGEFLEAEKLLERALETQGDHILAHERSKLYNDLAWVHYRLGHFDRSWENCLLVLKLLEKKQHPCEVAQAYNLMGAINWNRSKYEEAIQCHDRCLVLREEMHDDVGVAASYNNLGLVYRSLGKVQLAIESFGKSMEIKRRNNNLNGMAAAHLNIALTYLDMERFDDAEENCRSAIRLAEDTGNQQLLAEAFGTMGEVCFHQGALDEARDQYFKDLHICRKTKSLREQAVIFRRLGELSLAEGKIDEAADLLSQARELNLQIGSRLEATLLNLLEGRIQLACGKRSHGRQLLEGTSLELSLLGRKAVAASITAEIGEMCLEEGNEPLAREYLMRATSLVGESETVPRLIRSFRENIERRSPLSVEQIADDSSRFRVLCWVISLMRTIHDPVSLHETITETVRTITGMDRAALILQEDGGEAFRVVAATGGFKEGTILTDRNVSSILKIARQLGYPLDLSRTRIPDGRVTERFIETHRSIICIPLWIRDEVTGFLYLDSPKEGLGSSDDDHVFLVAFSQEVALGLERILLAEKITEIERRGEAEPPKPAAGGTTGRGRDIIVVSPAMRGIVELVDQVKNMDTTVLLIGQNGTGKDTVAKMIHEASDRSEKPFVSINLAAIPRDLLESQLFGHEKGAFTGAHRQKIGHFEVASSGTIFLNEIGDLPLPLQPKLLRVLEDQTFYRVGATREIETDARIIAATNQDLLRLVKEGKFREDLYYRINIFPIRVPSLRERTEDIAPLAEHFLTTFCRLYNIPRKRFSPEAMAYLLVYDWPGNVRELENLVIRLSIKTRGETILPEHLPEEIIRGSETLQAKSEVDLETTVAHLIEEAQTLKGEPILPKLEGIICTKMVEFAGDNKTKAAKLLGISKPTLYAKLKNREKNR